MAVNHRVGIRSVGAQPRTQGDLVGVDLQGGAEPVDVAVVRKHASVARLTKCGEIRRCETGS
eukprot:5267015-Prymnesium_polylepis.1